MEASFRECRQKNQRVVNILTIIGMLLCGYIHYVDYMMEQGTFSGLSLVSHVQISSTSRCAARDHSTV